MADHPGSSSDARHFPRRVQLGFALLIALFGVDFYLDLRARDVLSWMDPYQYYEFALRVLDGRDLFNHFEIPSIFPFLLMPALAASPTIPAALAMNGVFALLLLLAVHGLCRELAMRTPSFVVAALVLCSPLLIGLSRTLYVEYALSAFVALGFLAWLRFSKAADWRSGAQFALVLGVGFMLKMTFPLFFALPVAAAVASRLLDRRGRAALRLVYASAIPLLVVLAIQWTLFPTSFGYYTSLGNTALPIMYLIGPPEWMSWASFTYYFLEVPRTLLFLLTPFLLLAVLVPGRRLSTLRWSDLASPRATLWLWMLGPLLLLVAQPVKEPRHVAPCVVPAVLLLVQGIEELPWRSLRRVVSSLALLLAGAQYVAVTWHAVEVPYFMDRPLDWQEFQEGMIQSSAGARYAETPEELRLAHWKYDQNIAISGFPPNEALALTWQAFPGVVFDLDTLREPERFSPRRAYQRFEDLYLWTAFNAYNRRCGWRSYYRTLSDEAIVANADFVIQNGTDAAEALRRFPGHVLVRSIERGGELMHLLRNRKRSTTPYRALYAREFLARNPTLPPDERRVVATELLTVAALGGYERKVGALLREFPWLRSGTPPPRNIYWIGGYVEIAEIRRREMASRGSR